MSLPKVLGDLDSSFSDLATEAPYTSCIRIEGRPILPPVMTPERKAECTEWRQKAVEIEGQLSEKRRQRILSVVHSYRPSSAIEVKRFSSRPSSAEAARPSTSLAGIFPDGEIHATNKWESTASVNTVIENPNYSTPDEDSKPRLERRGSYTLDEPSPLLLAYMKRFGEQVSVETPRPPSVISTPRTTPSDRQQHLDEYLSDLSKPPEDLPPILPTTTAKMDVVEAVDKETVNDEAVESEKVEIMTEKVAKSEEDEASDRLSSQIKQLAEIVRKDSENIQQRVSLLAMNRPLEVQTPERDVTQTPELPSISSSLHESMSIRLPPSDSEKTPRPEVLSENETTPRQEVPSQIQEKTPEVIPESEKTSQKDDETQSDNKAKIEAAVATLAKQQQLEIERLLAQQAKERDQLRAMFKQQQDQLIRDVLGQLNSKSAPENKLEETVEGLTLETPKNDIPSRKRSTSPVIPTVAMHLRPESRALPEGFSFPDEVHLEENHRKFCRLSALAKGYLTRKLMKTDKVQGIVGSMRDTMSIALQLHQEARLAQTPSSHSGQEVARRVTLQDVELHRRLLQQLYKDSMAFHDVFFKLSPAQRIKIIDVDRQSKNKPPSNEHHRVSAVTRARIQQKKQIQQLIIENNFNPGPQNVRQLTRSAPSPRSKSSKIFFYP